MKVCDIHVLETAKARRAKWRVVWFDLDNLEVPPTVFELCPDCGDKEKAALGLERFEMKAEPQERREGEVVPDELDKP